MGMFQTNRHGEFSKVLAVKTWASFSSNYIYSRDPKSDKKNNLNSCEAGNFFPLNFCTFLLRFDPGGTSCRAYVFV